MVSRYEDEGHPPESSFTAPHRVTPNPGWWHAPDGDTTEVEVTDLIGGLVRAIQPELVIETGTAFGYTTRQIGVALRANGHGRCLSFEIDGERANMARMLCQADWLEDQVEIVEMSSLEFLTTQTVQFALFDSLYELRRHEFLRYYLSGMLLPGSIVAFHDWTSGIRGHYMDVSREVEQLELEGKLKAVRIPTPRGLVIGEVR